MDALGLDHHQWNFGAAEDVALPGMVMTSLVLALVPMSAAKLMSAVVAVAMEEAAVVEHKSVVEKGGHAAE